MQICAQSPLPLRCIVFPRAAVVATQTISAGAEQGSHRDLHQSMLPSGWQVMCGEGGCVCALLLARLGAGLLAQSALKQ